MGPSQFLFAKVLFGRRSALLRATGFEPVRLAPTDLEAVILTTRSNTQISPGVNRTPVLGFKVLCPNR
jgi:hypothetical protein